MKHIECHCRKCEEKRKRKERFDGLMADFYVWSVVSSIYLEAFRTPPGVKVKFLEEKKC